MAASGYTPILIYGSSTASNVPLAANLTTSASGVELAINAADGKLFYKDSGGVVQVLATKAGAFGTVTSVAATVPSFLSISGSPITSSGTLAIGLSGAALPTTSGGTGLTSFTANGVVYASSTSALATGSALTYNGTTFKIGGTLPTLTVSVDSGTQDTYTYFNNTNVYNYIYFQNNGTNFGSMLAAYGTGMYYNFDTQIWRTNAGSEQMRLTSTGLGIGTSSPAQKLHLNVASGAVFEQITSGSNSVYLGWDSTNSVGTFQSNTALTFATGASYTERMRLDSSGNLGLGVTPSAWTSYKAIQVGATGAASFASSNSSEATIFANAYLNGASFKYVNSVAASYYSQSSGSHAWAVAPSGTAGNAISFTQAMTLDASGNLLVGTTTSGLVNANSCSLQPAGFAVVNHVSGAASGSVYAYFGYNALSIGTITQNGTTGVLYNIASDYRLKNIEGPVTNSGAFIDRLNPVQGSWKSDGSRFIGFLAHELQEASETVVGTGVKDGEEMQAIDYSNPELIANLVAELKSLRKRLAAAGI